MQVIFCSDPLSPRQPDSTYEDEVAAANSLGLSYGLIDYEALVNYDDSARAARRIAPPESVELALYRGWMLKPAHYRQLFKALSERGVQLINDPAAYQYCHYLPEWYPALSSHTPKSVWLKLDGDISMSEIMQQLQTFGNQPLIVKDYVKSRKHEWDEACYIPSAADTQAVERIVRRFVELQGESLDEGLVFREYVDFEPLTTHAKSGMPLTQEYRIFFLNGRPIYSLEYWEQGDYGINDLPMDLFSSLAAKIQSRFFTMDVAKLRNASWMVVELGDAQVAGLPQNASSLEFYQAVVNNWEGI